MKRVFVLALIVLFPVALTSFVWLEVIHGVVSRAIDGSGHYAAAQIYDQWIFPDTFGWTNAYFAGMSLPNFYPPLFFWLVSLLHHTGLVSFATAFKLVVAVPLILMPLVFWFVTYVHSGKNQAVAVGAAIASAVIYSLGEVIQPNNGLDMSSTLIDGFYTQPLGFVLMLFWILVYLWPRQGAWTFAGAAVLLALTVLANFFNAITAIIFIAAVLAWDIGAWVRAANGEERRQQQRNFLLHFLSPWVALALCAFWIVPMLGSYEYLVTRPLVRPLISLMTTPLWSWYFLAVTGVVIWLRHRTGRLGPYIAACFVLFLALFFAGSFAPAWFPLQVFRFFSTFNFLLCVPIGVSLAYVSELYLEKRKKWVSQPQGSTEVPSTSKQIVFASLATIILVGLAIAMASKKLTRTATFYTPENFERISGALEFGKTHKDGRYVVEVLPNFAASGLVRSDSLALNAYLGSQGNEVISIVYREASPNSSFFNAELNAFSRYRENFGISSALLADLDFIDQPLAQHIKRLQFIGVRYVIIGSQEMRDRLNREAGVAARHDIGGWTIFQLAEPVAPPVRVLEYRPALLVSDFTVKMRSREQYDFTRLAEEQFHDGWFDVLLVRSPEQRIDLLPELEQFGALVIDTYNFQDETKALSQLKNFAQHHTLILLSSDAPLFNRIKSELSQFPRAVVIDRPQERSGEWIDEPEPSEHYNSSSIRATWKGIRTALERSKLPVNSSEIKSQIEANAIQINRPTSSEQSVPVLIAQTFHPKWVRSDSKPLYAVTPFFTVGFFDQSTYITFQRSRKDRVALWSSAATLVLLGMVVGINAYPRLSAKIRG